MAKARWQREIEAGIEHLATEVTKRRSVSTVDPVADGVSYAIGEFRARLATLVAPGQELTVAEWCAEQQPPVSEQAARNWIRDGELPARSGPRGFLIPAGTVRQRRAKSA
jgi:hypothetical protein